jgi:trehalose/maltose hydrolase-like predicted phosphorylase
VRRWVFAVAVAGVLGVLPSPAAVAATAPGFTLSTTQPGGEGFAPAFVGNGYLAGRQPAAGQGFAQVLLEGGGGKHLATQSEVQGFYAKTTKKDEGLIERRAALPAWSRLDYDDGGGRGRFLLGRGTVRGYRQTLDLATGTLTTTLAWTSRAGRTTQLRYDVTPDRAHPHSALVRLAITPRFDGTIAVTDVIDGQAAEHAAGRGRGQSGRTQFVDLQTLGLNVRATVASVLTGPGSDAARAVRLSSDRRTQAQRVSTTVATGKTYTFTKHVGVAVSTDAGQGLQASPHDRAVGAARDEAARGYARARAASDAAWADVWRGDIQVSGDARLRRQVRAALFALFASVRDDTPWAPSPGGLSSDGYNGHVFWDSETWMYPSLLATAPALAREMLQYRVDRLAAARRYARQTGFRGARFPWESALTGSEETPSCCNTGKYEIHVTADISLAMWQYWLATGDRAWLANQAWPTLSAIADFWVSRSHPNADGTRSIDNVIPPDEYHEQVADSVYTNVAARDALRMATDAAAITGHPADPQWNAVAGQLRVLFDAQHNVHPEFFKYKGDTIKQADVALLAYPWENPQPDQVTQADLDYYVPRVDPDGPSMTDAIHSILTSQLGTPGCAAFSFTKRSVDPFVRGPYEQFAEARTGGAFTFTTGAGGFLQEFLYGYSGWRWRGDRVRLDPSLPPQLTGVTLRAVQWHDRTLRIAIGRQSTTVTLLHGAQPVPVETPAGPQTLQPGKSITLPTRRPDETATDDVARCRAATASPETAEPPQSAVDGTRVTSWLAEKPGTHVQVDLGTTVPLGSIAISRPDVLAIATGETSVEEHAKTKTTRSAAETVAVSADGRTWQTIASVAAPPIQETFAGDGRPVRYVRVTAGRNASAKRPLVVGELAVQRRAG